MSLFDMLGLGGTKDERDARAIARLQKKVVEKFGPPENRQGAIEDLGKLGTERAIEALLTRFTVRIDPGITDDEEKKRTLDLIVDAGEIALPAIKRFITQREEISWPLKALADLVPEFEVVKVLVAALEKSAQEYARVPEKKALLLHAAGQHRSLELIGAAVPHLLDPDDEVVIAAAQAIAVQARPEVGSGAGSGAGAGPPAGSEAGREPLIAALLRAQQEKNARRLDALAGLLAESPWDVKGHEKAVQAALPAGFGVDGKARVVRK